MIPIPLSWWGMGGLAVALVGVLLVEEGRIAAAQNSTAKVQLTLTEERNARSVETASRVSAAASEVERLTRERELANKVRDAAAKERESEIEKARLAQRQSADSADRMRAALSGYNAARRRLASADPAASAGSAPAAAADVVPAGLYFWADGRARELAEYITLSARPAGQLCERVYEAEVK